MAVSLRKGKLPLVVESLSPWVRRLDGWALFAFGAGTCLFFGYGQQRALGIIMVASIVLANLKRPRTAFRRMRPVPPELWLYTAWVVWAGTTGAIVADDRVMFLTGFRVLAQMFVMVWAAYAILRQLSSINVVLLALIGGVLIQVVMVFTGAGSIAPSAVLASDQRLTGTLSNPNGLGFLMVWCVVAAFFFWKTQARGGMVRQPLILSIVAVATVVLLASGSRKSAVALGLLVYLWFVYARGASRGIKKAAASLLLGATALAVLASFGPGLLQETPVGQRFETFIDEGGGDVRVAAQSNIRYRMYVDGLRLFGEHPVFGVGLNNFGAHFVTGQYSHSDIIEPLATTGLIGFLLYQAFYVLVLVRAWRLLGIVHASVERYRLRIVLIGMLAIVIIGLGAPHYTNTPVYLLLTAFSVYTARLKEQYAAALAARRAGAGARFQGLLQGRPPCLSPLPGRFPSDVSSWKATVRGPGTTGASITPPERHL